MSPAPNSGAVPAGKRSITVAVPALNEEKNIAATIQAVLGAAAKVPELHVEVIVVDDGSRDRTAEIVEAAAARHPNVRLLRNPQNIGLGASIRRAIDLASTEKFLFIPGDNDIPAITLELLFINASKADLVMLYFQNDESRGRVRHLVSQAFRLIYTTTFDLYVMYINGPAVYPLAQLRELDLHSTRFSIVAEINVKLLRQGLSFIEIPSNRQVGLEGSTSATLRSLAETVRVYLQVARDVYFRDPQRYGRRPVRVPYEASLARTLMNFPQPPGAD